MLKLIAVLAGTLSVAVFAVLVIFIVGMRAKARPVLDAMRRVNRSVFNPKQMKSAGTPGAYASVVRHTGRATGNAYQTPVGAVNAGDGFLVTLPYGTRPDWVKNVLASRAAILVTEGRAYHVDRPEILPIEAAAAHFSPKEQRSHRFYGTDQCLRFRRIAAKEQPTVHAAPGPA